MKKLFLNLALLAALGASGRTVDLGNGFLDHGVAIPVACHRGTVATAGKDGKNTVLLWLYDHNGGYALLQIDPATGRSRQQAVPFPTGGDGPFASILSSKNRFYSHYNGYFVEYDPVAEAFTFHGKTTRQMAMSMTEDDAGRIWSATYPGCGVAAFDPATRKLIDYGRVNQESWAQYPRSIAVDDHGIVYIGIGNTRSQFLAFNPGNRKTTALLAETERIPAAGATVWRGADGKVYGRNGKQHYRFYDGKMELLPAAPKVAPKPCIADSQSLFHREFPDGARLVACDLEQRMLSWQPAGGGEVRKVAFDYTTEGAHVMSLCGTPDGRIIGGTAFPMDCFSYDIKNDAMSRVGTEVRQWNTLFITGDLIYIAAYTGGYCLEYDIRRPWRGVARKAREEADNPVLLGVVGPAINRPHAAALSSDGRIVAFSGTPGYGRTGGGLALYRRDTRRFSVIPPENLLQSQSVYALAPLPGNRMLLGGTTLPGSGGETLAKEATLAEFDLESGKIVRNDTPIAGVKAYYDFHVLADGRIIGWADGSIFFVYDPAQHRMLKQTAAELRVPSAQGPRLFAKYNGRVYGILTDGIAVYDPEAMVMKRIAASPVPVGGGSAVVDGRYYFFSRGRIYSYALDQSR